MIGNWVHVGRHMLILGLLAILVVGIGLPLATATGIARLARRGRQNLRPGNYPTVTFGAENVAVLIAAHDRADRIVEPLNSAATVVSLSNICLVSDDSND